jgi:hypothetical protein
VIDCASSVKDFFSKKTKTVEGHYVVGKCDKLLRETINANTFEVVISDVTIDKNIKHHNDLSIEDYMVLDCMLKDYHFLVKDGDKTAGIIYSNQIQYYYALKATKSGDTIFLTSFRKTNKNDIKRINNKAKKGLVEIIIDKAN